MDMVKDEKGTKKGSHVRTRKLDVTRRLTEKGARVDTDRRKRMGSIIKALREHEGMTQLELARAVGQEYNTFISQIENGNSKIPSQDIAIWARALAVQAEHLAKVCLAHYDPMMFEAVFPKEKPEDVVKLL